MCTPTDVGDSDKPQFLGRRQPYLETWRRLLVSGVRLLSICICMIHAYI